MNPTAISLRRRVALACTMLGFLLSLLFAGAVAYTAEDYEAVMVEEVMRGQAEDYSVRLAVNPDLPLPRTHRLSGYRRDRLGHSDIPAEFAALPTGFHESEQEDVDGIHVGVFDTPAGRLVFVMDLRDIEQLELHLSWFMAAMIVLGTALAGWLGWWLAGKAVAPVSRLAEAVDALPTQPQATALAASVSHDELGRLASAIDRYQARLVEADAYEQTFFADASHELRTPVAVVRGTAEVLLDGPEADPGMRQRLRRLDRGMQELTDLLDVLLDLARRREMQMETMDARALLAEAASASTGAGTAVRVEIEAAGTLLLPRRESLLLLRSLIRRLLLPDVPGLLRLRLHGSTVEFGFAPDDGPPSSRDTQSQRSDRGFGLTLTARLAERMGWRWQQAGDGLLRVSLPDSALI